MAREKEPLAEYSTKELEEIVAARKRAAHASRLERFRKQGRALPEMEGELDTGVVRPEGADTESVESGARRLFSKNTVRWIFNRLLLWVEIAAVFGMAYVFFRGFGLLQDLNQEAAEAFKLPTGTPTPLITALVLPSGHLPPTSPGGAAPNEEEIPANLRPLVQSMPSLQAPTPGPEHASQIFIEALWNNPQPIVQGDGWEQLKKGVGQHVGSANPGETGNLVLSAHNDIFGELFRYLDRLRPGDEIEVRSATKEYVYVVTGFRLVHPTDVTVMEPTEKPTITLISCYPYLVDSQRIVIFGELKDA